MLPTAANAESGCRGTAAVGVPVRIVAAGGRDGVERREGWSGLPSAPCGLAGTEGTRSATLRRDVSAPGDHGGA